MTEQEAKDVLEAYMKCEKRKNNLVYEEKCNNDCDNCELCYEKGTVGEHKEAVEMAIKALEEIKQYRTIGTPEECRAAVEKQKSKTPIRNDKCTCPSCGTHNEVFKKRRNTVTHDIAYCWHCGQAVEIDRLE